MKILGFAFSALLLLLSAGCSTNNPVAANILGLPPSAAKSEYLRTVAGGFTLTKGEAGSRPFCKYTVVVAPARPLSGPLYFRTRFENPDNPSDPYIVDSEMIPDNHTLTLESPPIRHLQPYCSYKVEVLIYDSSERTRQIGKHVQWVQWASLAQF